MREVVLDTETTGLDPKAGHRVVEIGCLELINHVATGETYHVYLNPERDMPEDAARVHGLTTEFLSTQQLFAQTVDAFLDFVADDPLVIHNAAFDMGFMNAELARLGFPALKNEAIDTVRIARKKFPGAPASLDALCRRFEIDNSNRTLHGALLDSELLAEVYLELMGGRQTGLGLDPVAERAHSAASDEAVAAPVVLPTGPARPARPHAPSAEELAAHAAFLEKIDNPVWHRAD